MIVVPHPIPAVNKIRAFIVKTDKQEFTGPGRAAAEGHVRGAPFCQARPAMRADKFFVLVHISSPESSRGDGQA